MCNLDVTGRVAIALTVLAVVLGIVAAFLPGWVTSSTVNPSWSDCVKQVNSRLDIWGIYVNVDLSNKVIIPASDFSFKACYLYFTPALVGTDIVESTLTKDNGGHDDGHPNGCVAGGLGVMCTVRGKDVVTLVMAANAFNVMVCFFVVHATTAVPAFVARLAKVFVLLSLFCSVAMFVFAPVYLEFAAVVVTCLAGCAISSFEAIAKNAISSSDINIESSSRQEKIDVQALGHRSNDDERQTCLTQDLVRRTRWYEYGRQHNDHV
ncbi:Aste57867_13299 [Aphanomyces stellatus]|uniref:Aste57867_13299 protein n=1 Tax=Aphanomyces stellatus TaxID=120398 RepID=A0A485KY15_9STRA|nr:hypothetical protein As57867_013250 [Aphanomyces stellatus]VFT90138.1 Aste57867_13299 [Aphanomyces stellatus]